MLMFTNYFMEIYLCVYTHKTFLEAKFQDLYSDGKSGYSSFIFLTHFSYCGFEWLLKYSFLVGGSGGYLRLRRQTEVDSMDTETDNVPEDGQGGFFDRAAKFMMDLLQRFLKWINSDSN